MPLPTGGVRSGSCRFDVVPYDLQMGYERDDARGRPRRKPPKVTASWMRGSGTAYLQRYAATTARFRRVMKRKIDRSVAHWQSDPEEAAELLDELVVQLQEAGWLDDARFTKARVADLHRRGTSRRMIQAKLAAQGGPRELVQEALAELSEGEGNAELRAGLAYARRRRLGPFRIDPDQRRERREKDLASMGRAGFAWSIAREVIDAEDVDRLEEEAGPG